MEILMKDYPYFTIYSEAQDVVIDGVTVSVIPWINSSNLDKTLKYVKKTKAQICFGHLELKGFEMDQGHVCIYGMEKNIFSKFEIVLSGHFHHKSTDGQFYYLGAQYQLTFGDVNDVRGFHTFDTETRELKFIPNPYQIFHKFIYDDTNDENMTFEKIKETDFSMYRDCYIKVLVLNKKNPYLFDLVIDKLQKVNPTDLSVMEDFTLMDSTEEYKISGEEQGEDTLTYLGRYVDGLDLTERVDKKRLKNVLRELYIESVNLDSSITLA